MFSTVVNADLTVTVTINGVVVDEPGPWGDVEGAELWASAMLADLEAGVKHYPQQDEL